MTKRAWVLIVTGYLVGALGFVIAISIVADNQDKIEANQDRIDSNAADIAEVAGALCTAIVAPTDKAERAIMFEIADPTVHVEPAPVCRGLVERIEN